MSADSDRDLGLLECHWDTLLKKFNRDGRKNCLGSFHPPDFCWDKIFRRSFHWDSKKSAKFLTGTYVTVPVRQDVPTMSSEEDKEIYHPDPVKQVLTIILIIFIGVICAPFIAITVLYVLYHFNIWPILYPLIFYITSYLLFDWSSPSRGGRRSQKWREKPCWKHFSSYFPIELIKTHDLDPMKNYIFGFHPHGVLASSAWANFCTEATGFSDLFPGIKPHLLVLKLLFILPVFREMYMWFGMCDVSKSSIEYICDEEKQHGNAAVIIIGGAAESLECRPGSSRIHLKDRKGFVKMALLTGAQLVPVYSFGENDIYTQVSNPEGSWLRTVQDTIRHWMTFAIPAFYGRGLLKNSFGWLPFRKRLSTVVGAPIPVTKTENPSQSEIDDLHHAYMNELTKLFDEYKGQYSAYPDAVLEIV